jgi:hypothetical protein
MSKLTKQQSKAHRAAEDLLCKDVLTLDEKIFVYENWNEAATHDNTRAGAFFTPMGLANDFKLEVPGPRIIDICAGIGILSFCKLHFQHHDPDRSPQITCVEINPDYVRVGRKLLPEAEWICADIFAVWRDLPRDFTTAIANPPFGNIRHAGKAPRYSGTEFEYKIIDIAAHLADYGVFIIPQMSAPFRYSGAPYYQRQERPSYQKFARQTGIRLDAGCGIDTTYHRDGWKHTAPAVEIACCEFSRYQAASQPDTSSLPEDVRQLSLFERAA